VDITRMVSSSVERDIRALNESSAVQKARAMAPNIEFSSGKDAEYKYVVTQICPACRHSLGYCTCQRLDTEG
jgi:hypothetical protein